MYEVINCLGLTCTRVISTTLSVDMYEGHKPPQLTIRGVSHLPQLTFDMYEGHITTASVDMYEGHITTASVDARPGSCATSVDM
ncbi:hypothetical protein Btru_076344 [Bulinus truncatus]|nr:hypothetical protein Btru_076344 [Bulinus truncatus]